MSKIQSYKSMKPYGKPKRKRVYKKRVPQSLLPKTNRTPEIKYISTNLSTEYIDNTGSDIFLINGLDQGVTSSTRIGNKTKNLSVNFNLMFGCNTSNVISCELVYDKDVAGQSLQVSDYLTSFSGAYPPWCLRRPDIKDRFVTLKKWEFPITPQIASTTVNKVLKGFVRIRNGVATLFNGSGSSVGAINKGALYMLFHSNNGAGTTTFVSGSIRVGFIDD